MQNKSKPFSICISVFLLTIFVACSTKPSQSEKIDSTNSAKTTVTESNPAFLIFIKKFKFLPLPLTIKTLDIAADSFQKLNAKDNVFIKSEYPDEIYAYGILPDTADFYKIIWLQPAEIEVPVLTTFSKTGKKISEKYLSVGGCGSDCGFSCAEFITIGQDLTIFSRDSITSSDCDTAGNLKPNTTKKYIRFEKGSVLKSGKIKMSKISEKPI